MLEVSFDFWEAVCYVHIYGFFSFAQPNGVCGTSVCAKKKKNVFKYAESIKIPNEKREINKINLGKQINYFANHPQKC